MKEAKNSGSAVVANLDRRKKFKYVLIAEGALIGLITGALVSVFRLMLSGADKLRGMLAEYVRGGGAGPALVCALVLVIIAAVITLLLGWEPDIAGSGIPQVEAELRGQKDMCWWRVIAGKMAGCALAIGGGLALGREGPSIQLGAMVGKGIARSGHRLLTEERLLITCGAGAGLSAAFGAPLAGAIFSLEELHRNFSAEVLLTTMAAAAAGDFVTANILGLAPVFVLENGHGLPLRYYWAVVLLGLALGLFGVLYNRTIAFMQDGFERFGKAFGTFACRVTARRESIIRDGFHPSIAEERFARAGRMLVALAAAYILFFVYPDALGSGSFLVDSIGRGDYALKGLIVLLLIKFVFSTASFGSGSPGGIFLPLLVLGAITGGLFSRLLGLAGMDQEYITAFVIIAMAGYFAAIVRAPVTGVVLITEMTGDFTSLLPLVLVSLTAYVVAEALGAQPIYTQLLERSLGKSPSGRSYSGRGASLRDRKTVIDAEVDVGSRMDGSHVSEFGLPIGTLIVSVTRGGIEIIPDGNTILRAGDELEILTREADIADVGAIVDAACRSVEKTE
ncbi:MAG: ClC family H(+)/Cl(-) exchange transporter [Clostridiales bacterium]|nr:ClC family H(+)/Cl(-) exchange transporter [Clostridiales bacterium]